MNSTVKIKQDETYTNNDEDIALITGFLEGVRASFDRLVLKYQDRVVNLCVRTIGNYADGEDAAQETFMKVYKNLNKFKGESLFTTWLYRIAVNTSKNYGRSWWSRLKRRAVNLDAPIETEEGERTYEIGDTRFSPVKELQRLQIADNVKKALDTLPEKHKELIILRDIEELRYEEIETILGVSMGTVKSRLARARSAMQEKLRGKVNGV